MKLAKLYCVSIIVNIFVLIFSADLLEEEENDTLDLESELYQDFDYLDESKNSQDFDDYFAEPEIDDISDLEESEIAQGLKITLKSLNSHLRFF